MQRPVFQKERKRGSRNTVIGVMPRFELPCKSRRVCLDLCLVATPSSNPEQSSRLAPRRMRPSATRLQRDLAVVPWLLPGIAIRSKVGITVGKPQSLSERMPKQMWRSLNPGAKRQLQHADSCGNHKNTVNCSERKWGVIQWSRPCTYSYGSTSPLAGEAIRC
jgi:hypothetical protein